MKISTKFLQSIMTLVGIFAVQFASAQCPAISCPGNQTVNNTPGTCGAVVTYATPVGTNPCGGGGNPTTFNYTGGMQTYTVPAGVTNITVDAYGAGGGTSTQGNFIGGAGARIKGDYAVTPGQIYNILVGGRGSDGTCGSGGGGGSFVERAGVPVVIAGGGGGGFFCFALGGVVGGAGQITTSGGAGINCPNRLPYPGGAGGNGGQSYYGGGGGGWLSAGIAMANPPEGGGVYPGAGGVVGGGYGGGGGYYGACCGGSGGGGGYSGGSGGQSDGCSGGGGGSINNGTNQTNTAGVQNGNGQVIITPSQIVQTYSYTGSLQTFTVPAGVTSINIQASGAQGATSANPNGGDGNGGLGGFATGDLAVTPGQVLNIYVGGQGAIAPPFPGFGGAGYNGGGNGASGYSAGWLGGGGGGASDVRVGGVALADRKVVAAGGGGGGSNGGTPNANYGGIGGGLLGGNGGSITNAGQGNGATQLVGGADGVYDWAGNAMPGALGIGGDANSGTAGGGGGGGYYGGGGAEFGGGGGGSSFIGGVANSSTQSGIRSGNGQVILTYSGGAGAATTTQTAGLASGATFPVGTTTNTFQVSDGLGNTASCSFTVTVVDNQAPAITCPGNITVNNAAGMCDAVVTFNAPVGTDNCSATTALTAGLPSGSTFPVGVTTQTYTATDAAGNASSCSFTVTVVDAELPTITCPANVATCNPLVTGIAPTSINDNCAGTTVAYALTGATTGNGNTDASGTTFNVGTTSVMYTVTDAAGNTNNCAFNVVIHPTPVVVLSAFANDTICEGDAAVALPNATPAGGTFSGAGVVGGNFNPATAGTGNHYVVYSSTNVEGCTDIDSTMITVVVCAGIKDGSNGSSIVVYPNPTSGMITINLGSMSKSIEVTVMELNGKLVKSEKYSNSNNVRMDISNLSDGMYFVTVKSDNELKQVKVVKN